MFRIFLSILMTFIFLAGPLGLRPSFGMDAKINWKVTGLGKSASEPLVASNGLMYFLSGNKLTALDTSGRKVLDIKAPAGSNKVIPVMGPGGSVFLASSGSIREIKPNGGSGWSINIQDAQKQSSSLPHLSLGPGNMLYLPLPTALYAIGPNGSYKWRMFWDTQEANYPLVDTKREILSCAASDDYLYVVYSINKGNCTLAAISPEGNCDWLYKLGSLKGAGLATDPEGNLYVTVNPKDEKTQKGKLYCFELGCNGYPSWSYATSLKALTAPAFSGSGVVYFCASEYLFAIDISDGEEIWRQKFYNADSRPTVNQYDSKIYLGTSDERLLAVGTEGRLDWDIELEGNVTVQPYAVAAGELYVTTDKGVLYSITETSPGGD